MSSKKRSSQAGDQSVVQRRSLEQQRSFSVDHGLGNEGYQHSIAGGRHGVGLEVVSATASPIVQHTMMALQLMMPETERTGRLRTILHESDLAPELKIQLSATLALKESQANTVHKAMVETLGADSEVLRGEVWACLYQCWHTLQDGAKEQRSDAFVTANGEEVELTPSSEGATLTERAHDLVGDIAGHLAGESLSSMTDKDGGASLAVRSLCRALYLAVNFDEEEEEEEWAAPEME